MKGRSLCRFLISTLSSSLYPQVSLAIYCKADTKRVRGNKFPRTLLRLKIQGSAQLLSFTIEVISEAKFSYFFRPAGPVPCGGSRSHFGRPDRARPPQGFASQNAWPPLTRWPGLWPGCIEKKRTERALPHPLLPGSYDQLCLPLPFPSHSPSNFDRMELRDLISICFRNWLEHSYLLFQGAKRAQGNVNYLRPHS